MSAIAPGIDPLPDGTEQLPSAVVARKRGWLRRLPGKAKVGGVILAVFILVAIIGAAIAPFDPNATTPGQALPLAPNATHLLGTTATGQDVLSQLLVGTRSTVVLGLLTGLIATFLSVVIGIVGGVPRRGVRRGAVIGRERVPGPAGAAAAGRDPRLPTAFG